MTRHGKNSTASSFYSYHEKRKDTAEGGYGTISKRLSKDSVKGFDCCSLTLQPCQDPVVTSDGYLYDREAILECLLHQKKEIARKTKEYEKQRKHQEKEQAELAAAEQQAKEEAFVKHENRITSAPIDPFKEVAVAGSSKGSKSVSNMSGEKRKDLPSFWIPSLTPDAKPTSVKKPDKKTYCPMSGKQLRVKDLVTVSFTRIDDAQDKSLIAKEVRYKCAVTHDALGNSVPCVVLKSCGKVVTTQCFERLIKKDMLCPITGQKLKDNDIIALQRGGTGYSSVNELQAKTYNPVMIA
ncbi:nitric oxide synthase-interacting protein-like isoform X2 [Corticium candelabrum]|uniref:nitric oxide synthase-interacting protein-like isoform X2 n=1 Tax=Corticium candelabrum TaxID=121492 RepID=UPI002E2758F8|nr:nitric oxide synthase-interacting protein-like isoform X2 [Corticium candelabrum]